MAPPSAMFKLPRSSAMILTQLCKSFVLRTISRRSMQPRAVVIRSTAAFISIKTRPY